MEAILDHKYVKNVLLFQVKWQGYDNEEDRTWEPEENLATASDILTEYYADIGGRPTASAGGKKRGRKPGAGAKRSFSESNGETPEASSAPGRKKRAGNGEEIIDAPRKKKDKYPPIGSSNWDKEVLGCVTIVEEPNNHKGVGEKFALLKWENGENTKHALRIAHDHAPKAVSRSSQARAVFAITNSFNRCLHSTKAICKCLFTSAVERIFC